MSFWKRRMSFGTGAATALIGVGVLVGNPVKTSRAAFGLAKAGVKYAPATSRFLGRTGVVTFKVGLFGAKRAPPVLAGLAIYGAFSADRSGSFLDQSIQTVSNAIAINIPFVSQDDIEHILRLQRGPFERGTVELTPAQVTAEGTVNLFGTGQSQTFGGQEERTFADFS